MQGGGNLEGGDAFQARLLVLLLEDDKWATVLIEDERHGRAKVFGRGSDEEGADWPRELKFVSKVGRCKAMNGLMHAGGADSVPSKVVSRVRADAVVGGEFNQI